jgi:hypothetical protein
VNVPDFPLVRRGEVSDEAKRLGWRSFADAARFVRRLPYGRNRRPSDPLAILREGVGTCSTKHVFLARLAREQGRGDVRLFVGLYRMTGANTPGVESVLLRHRLRSLPEAHCYLKRGRQRHDFTRNARSRVSPFRSLIEERAVAPDWVARRKPVWHRARLLRWARTRGMAPEVAWAIREECIDALA